MNGGPVAGATVIFSPQDGQPTATARTNDAGEYSLTTYDYEDGAAEGKFIVLISKAAPPAKNDAPEHDPTGASGRVSAPDHAAGKKGESSPIDTILDPKYATNDSGLEAAVTAGGDNVFDFKL